jgi:hypothetical protein
MAKNKKMGWRERILLAGFIVAAIVFLPITAVLFIGMLPTVMARLTDKTKEKTKVLTVGFMNFAGCFPFLYELVDTGLKLENALQILSDPLTIVMIYSCAVLGYAVEWLVTNMVAGLLVQKGRNRLETIKKIQEGMVKQWGPEVMGDIPLDPYGFPLESNDPPPQA